MNAPRDDAAVRPLLPIVGASACLLGQNVRVNRGHCRERFLTDVLGPFVQYLPVCPEVEMGMGVPRPPIRLLQTEPEGPPRVVMSDSGADRTQEMAAYTAARLEGLAADALDGYVFKKDSPTCGLFRVKVYGAKGGATRKGEGFFAGAFRRRFPLVPVEEEGRLNDTRLRENFVIRIFTRARWRAFLASAPTAAGFVRFHTDHKMLLLAHNQTAYREMGRLVAGAGDGDLGNLLGRYEVLLMHALARPAATGRHINVLQHLSGFVKDALEPADKRELEQIQAHYRAGRVPLSVPLTLLRHHLRRHAPSDWPARQVYLAPYPPDLTLFPVP